VSPITNAMARPAGAVVPCHLPTLCALDRT
jgi:hypothetical protein